MSKEDQRILIVEDDKLLSFVEERLIKKLGYSLAGKADNGEEAIQAVQEEDPDLIVMDVNLDNTMDGIEAMNQIRQFSSTPVIFLSGDNKQATHERISQISNCVDYLIKPVNADGLRKPLKRALASNASGEDTKSAKSV